MVFRKECKWQAKFHLSKVAATTRSVQAFKDYLRVNEFEEIGGEFVSDEF
jgi:hypothetical protein